MRGAFDRLELVSREDFDILMDVLQRTRSRVEALERQVATLEATVEASTAPTATPLEAEVPPVPTPSQIQIQIQIQIQKRRISPLNTSASLTAAIG
ncbi:hypothetical protein HSBAA_63210 [Vreelandella sulfidaeris]|uniref:Ubiquinone biosynthesis accessory factor UbiK n=1 Tax=Vreelandella sulfidaeris TaxID=115553 RepID=A0A455UFX8_9GAMM|nr:hypothetical protein HSBAA_63210 [Halomonas sulfidaeris]